MLPNEEVRDFVVKGEVSGGYGMLYNWRWLSASLPSRGGMIASGWWIYHLCSSDKDCMEAVMDSDVPNQWLCEGGAWVVCLL